MDENLQDALIAGGLDIDSQEVSDNYQSEVGKKSAEYKKELETMAVTTNNLLFAFEDINGEPIPPREENGTYFVDMIDIDKIAYSGSKEDQIRQGDLNVFEIQQVIEKVGIIEPIHVVPFGRPIINDSGLPKYNRYLILSGRRRYEASRALGHSSILAVVNTTINNQLIEMYKGILQNTKPYTFSEKVAYAERMSKEQRSLSVEALENFLGYKSGEFLKSLYINQMKVDYPDIYMQVDKDKMTIEQAFKRLEKEIEKAEKAMNEADEMDGDDVEDALRGKQGDELSQLQIDNHTQELGNRHILDANIRRAVESRDQGTCQCCGFGAGEEDFMGGFNAHHIVPVMYQGPDQKGNLILLCKNCHGFVHDYEVGRFNPDKKTYDNIDWVKRVVVLGNMLRKLRTKSIKEIAKKDPDTYRVLQKGALSLGKAIAKSGITVGGMEMFDDDPYQKFMDAVESFEYGLTDDNELNELENFKDDLEIEEDKPEENHKSRNLSKQEIVSATAEEIRKGDESKGLIKKDEPIEELKTEKQIIPEESDDFDDDLEIDEPDFEEIDDKDTPISPIILEDTAEDDDVSDYNDTLDSESEDIAEAIPEASDEDQKSFDFEVKDSDIPEALDDFDESDDLFDLLEDDTDSTEDEEEITTPTEDVLQFLRANKK